MSDIATAVEALPLTGSLLDRKMKKSSSWISGAVVAAALIGGSFHAVDSSELSFKIAASMAFREAVRTARPVILEPIMKTDVTVPEACVGDVIHDLNSRRGRIREVHARGKVQVISAYVPLSEMFGYATALRSLTQGRGTSIMEFHAFEEQPSHVPLAQTSFWR